MKRLDVDEMLDDVSAQTLMRWMAFLAVRAERRRETAEDDDDEVTHWGDEPDDDGGDV